MVTLNDIETVALNLMCRNHKGKNDLFIRRFRARFGLDPCNVHLLCGLLERHGKFDCTNTDLNITHLFWALEFLKNYSNEQVQSDKFGVDSKTYRKWFWIYVKAISSLAPRLVSYGLFKNEGEIVN